MSALTWPKAKVGDLIAVVRKLSHTGLHGPTEEREVVHVAVATRVNREGIVTWYALSQHAGTAYKVALADRVLVVGGPDRVRDIGAVIDAAHKHCYPGHPDQMMPFDDIEEVKALVLPWINHDQK